MVTYGMNEYFLPGEGIDREVINSRIARYLGVDTVVRPGVYSETPGEGQFNSVRGYFITSYRNPTSAMIQDLKKDSRRKEEKRALAKKAKGGHLNKRNRGYDRKAPQNSHIPSHTYLDSSYPELKYGPDKNCTSNNSKSSNVPTKVTSLLPVLEHITPNRKDLPMLIDGTYVRVCADFGASDNFLSYRFVKEQAIPFEPSYCQPFELPTFGRLIRPIGTLRLTCEFPGEPDSLSVQTFFVLDAFVHKAIIGRAFLRQTRTFDLYRHRLQPRPVQTREIPVVALLGSEEETLKFWLDGEPLTSTPDTGSEINVMSLEFARTRGFRIEAGSIHQARFADGSLQDVKGLVKVPVSFGHGAPPSLLLKLVNYSSASPLSSHAPVVDSTGRVDYGGHMPSILAEFHILNGLRVDVIFGEDLLATVNAFVCHSADFEETTSSTSLYPSLGTIGLVKKVGQKFCELLGKQSVVQPDPERERDIADSRELDRYERERIRCQQLSGDRKTRAERKNEFRRKLYIANRGTL